MDILSQMGKNVEFVWIISLLGLFFTLSYLKTTKTKYSVQYKVNWYHLLIHSFFVCKNTKHLLLISLSIRNELIVGTHWNWQLNVMNWWPCSWKSTPRLIDWATSFEFFRKVFFSVTINHVELTLPRYKHNHERL